MYLLSFEGLFGNGEATHKIIYLIILVYPDFLALRSQYCLVYKPRTQHLGPLCQWKYK